MAWFYLIIAGIFEIVWAIGIKHCDSFRINIPLIVVAVGMALSIIFLSLATKEIPMSTAYAVWSGVGIVGVFFYGVFFLKEQISILGMVYVAMILIGIIGLKLEVNGDY